MHTKPAHRRTLRICNTCMNEVLKLLGGEGDGLKADSRILCSNERNEAKNAKSTSRYKVGRAWFVMGRKCFSLVS